MSWDKYFIEMLPYIASKSKDTSTKVGAIIVDHSNIIVATGFNGFPREVKEDDPKRFERPTKYLFTEHAERNAIYAAARKGIALEGCKIYQPWLPCTDCARAIIQVGIEHIVIDGRNFKADKKYWDERWLDSMVASVTMLNESGVLIQVYDENESWWMASYTKSGEDTCLKEKDTG